MTKANKKMQAYYKQWKNSNCTELWQVYSTYSHYKHKAMENIKSYMAKVDGYGLRILGHNCSQFSCGYIATIDGEQCFVVETAQNTYKINLAELIA